MRDLVPARISLLVAFFIACALAAGMSARRDDRAAAAQIRRMTGLGARQWGRAPRAIVGYGLVALVVLSLLPAWPYSSQPALASGALSPSAFSVISPRSAVLTYPYVEPGTDSAMVWQAIDKMRFKLIGGYALRRGPDALSTPLPSGLRPYDVEGILLNALAANPVLIPNVPYLAPATRTVVAARVVVEPGAPRGAAASGRVQSINRDEGSFILTTSSNDFAQVTFSALTDFRVGTKESNWSDTPLRGEHVVVYGTVEPATIDHRRIRDLREFLFLNQVNAVVVEMGLPGSATVAGWVRAAIGPARLSRPGVEIWSNAQQRLRERKYGSYRAALR